MLKMKTRIINPNDTLSLSICESNILLAALSDYIFDLKQSDYPEDVFICISEDLNNLYDKVFNFCASH